MKKFARLFVKFWIVSVPFLLVLFHIFNGNWAAVFGIMAGWTFGRNFDKDLALLKDSYREFRNQKDDSNDESS